MVHSPKQKPILAFQRLGCAAQTELRGRAQMKPREILLEKCEEHQAEEQDVRKDHLASFRPPVSGFCESSDSKGAALPQHSDTVLQKVKITAVSFGSIPTEQTSKILRLAAAVPVDVRDQSSILRINTLQHGVRPYSRTASTCKHMCRLVRGLVHCRGA